MRGEIAGFIASTLPATARERSKIFGPRFQTLREWRAFLRTNLVDGKVSEQLAAPSTRWSVKSFQALYVACWIYHPMEKGSFMLDLVSLNNAARKVLEEACRKHCHFRISSHLSRLGWSASKGWNFLAGYHELLIQYEKTKGRPYLFLKAEGHAMTNLSGAIAHYRSWRHKAKHGVGLIASQPLADLAKTNDLVEERAAENFGKGYGKLLSVLGLSGKKVTIREMVEALFVKTGFRSPHDSTWLIASNSELGRAIEEYCARASVVGSGGLRFRMAGRISEVMISDLKDIACTLKRDGTRYTNRVFQEIRASPKDVDSSLQAFYSHSG